MTTDELKARTKELALRVIRLVDALPNSVKGHAIANQVMRSSTSVAANYRAACRARTRAEFIAKIGAVEEEADETAFWLELIIDSKIRSKTQIEPLLKEAGNSSRLWPRRVNRQLAIGSRQFIEDL